MTTENGLPPLLPHPQEQKQDAAQPTTNAPETQTVAHLALGLSPQGLSITVTPPSITATLGEEGMTQLVKGWLLTHPALLNELSRELLANKQRELKLIQHISESKNN